MMRAVVFAVLIAAAVASLPAPSYDLRTAKNGCGSVILNQDQCGSCWAFSSAMSLADRFCAAGYESNTFALSPQMIESCVTGFNDQGCDGGMPGDAWSYMAKSGIPTCNSADSCASGCVPFDFQCTEDNDANHDGCMSCPTKCTGSNDPFTLYKATSLGGVSFYDPFTTVSKAANAIYTQGTITTAFEVYENFFTFFNQTPTGVYTSASGSLLGGHAVRIIGWGTQGSTPYWLVANSWTTSWGDNGYFRIVQGKNLCHFESTMWWGTPVAPTAAHSVHTTVEEPVVFPKGRSLPGAWVDAEVTAEHVRAANDFASAHIAEHLATEHGLSVVHMDLARHLVSAKTQVVAGYNVVLKHSIPHANGGSVEVVSKVHMDAFLSYNLRNIESRRL